jgi:hypothetical protein
VSSLVCIFILTESLLQTLDGKQSRLSIGEISNRVCSASLRVLKTALGAVGHREII